LLGKTTALDAACKVQNQTKTGHVRVRSDTMQANLAFSLDEKVLTVNPSNISLNINPQVVSAVLPQDTQLATSQIPMKLLIGALEVPLAKAAFINDASLEATLHVDPFTVSKIGPVGTLDLIEIDLKLAKSAGKNLAVSANAKIDLQKAAPLYQ